MFACQINTAMKPMSQAVARLELESRKIDDGERGKKSKGRPTTKYLNYMKNERELPSENKPLGAFDWLLSVTEVFHSSFLAVAVIRVLEFCGTAWRTRK